VKHARQDRRRNSGDAEDECEEHGQNAMRSQIVVKASHCSFPLVDPERVLSFSKALLASEWTIATDLMISI
jgi:hypothetical protein